MDYLSTLAVALIGTIFVILAPALIALAVLGGIVVTIIAAIVFWAYLILMAFKQTGLAIVGKLRL